MPGQEPQQLNEFGLFVHEGARRAIAAARRENQVGHYPVYLVGLALREHRGGPAVVALLTLPDGGVLHVCARSLNRRRPNINKALEEDIDFLDGDDLQKYRSFFYSELGGFSLPCLESGPTAVAESMLENAFLGLRLAGEVGPSPQGPPGRFPSDWTDMVWYSRRGAGCAVEGFTPSSDQLVELDLPAKLTRAMTLSESVGLEWLAEDRRRIAEEVHPHVPELVEEAWAVRLLSPQGSVALLRSAAELVAAAQATGRKPHFNLQLNELEEQWDDEPLDGTPAGRRQAAWRARVLAHLHTVRDIGNRIHADSNVGSGDVEHAHAAMRDLLSAVLGTGLIDGYGYEARGE